MEAGDEFVTDGVEGIVGLRPAGAWRTTRIRVGTGAADRRVHAIGPGRQARSGRRGNAGSRLPPTGSRVPAPPRRNTAPDAPGRGGDCRTLHWCCRVSEWRSRPEEVQWPAAGLSHKAERRALLGRTGRQVQAEQCSARTATRAVHAEQCSALRLCDPSFVCTQG
jgi:hypothetical protein